MKKFFSKLIFYKFLSSFSIVFIIAGTGISERGTLKSYYSHCPVCGVWCHHSQFCNNKGKNITGGTIYYRNNNTQIAQQQAEKERKELEEKLRLKEKQERLRREEEEKKRKEEERKLKEEQKRKEEESKAFAESLDKYMGMAFDALAKKQEAEAKRQQEEEERKAAEEKALQKAKAKRQQELEAMRQNEETNEQIKKEVEEKLEKNEKLTREEDEFFNEGEQRQTEIESYLEKLRNEGNEKTAEALEHLMNHPGAAILSQASHNYFKRQISQFNYGSHDVVDKSIVNSIDGSTEMLQQLSQPSILNNQSIIDRLKESLVTGDNSLAKQADFLSSENDVTGALNTTSLMEGLVQMGNAFAQGVKAYSNEFDKRLEQANDAVAAGLIKVIDGVTYVATHPKEICEKIGYMISEAEDPALMQAMCQASPDMAQRRDEMHKSVTNVTQGMENTISDAASFVGKVGKDLLEFGSQYAPAFYSSDDYDGTSPTERAEMFKEQQQAQEKLKNDVHSYASSITPESIGKVAADCVFDSGVAGFVGEAAGALGKAAGFVGEAEAAYTVAREVEHAVEAAAPIAHQEVRGAQKVIEEIYKDAHGGLTPHEVRALAQKQAAERMAAEQAAARSAAMENTAASYAEREVAQEASHIPSSSTTEQVAADANRYWDQKFIEHERAEMAERLAQAQAEAQTVSYGPQPEKVYLGVDKQALSNAKSNPTPSIKNRSYSTLNSSPSAEELARLEAEAQAKKLLKKQLQQIERGVIPSEIAVKPFNEMLHEIKTLLLKSKKYSRENIDLFFQKASKHSSLLSNKKISLNLETYLNYGNKPPRYNLKHICKGEIREGKPKGFHHKPSAPEQIIDIITSPNEHGVYRATCKVKGSDFEKISNMFPDHWSTQKVQEKIVEAFSNIIEEKSMGRVGITSEGIKIEMWFIKDKLTQEIIMDTAYPLMS